MPPIIKKQELGPVLGISIYDLERLDASIRSKMLSGRLDLSNYIDTRQDKSADDSEEACVVFKCSLLEAAIICDWIRSNDRQLGQAITRCYINKKVAWNRIPDNIVLTEVSGDSVILSDFFLGNRPDSPIFLPPQSRSINDIMG